MAKIALLYLNKKYGQQYTTIIKLIHQLYGYRKECVTVHDIGDINGLYVYPYRVMKEEFDFTTSRITLLFKKMMENGHVLHKNIGSISIYKIDYENEEIINSGLVDPYKLTGDLNIE